MRLLIYMRDGRTVYALKGRTQFRKLIEREPWHEDHGTEVDRGTWNPHTGEYIWRRIRVRFIAKGSISSVEEETPAGIARREELVAT